MNRVSYEECKDIWDNKNHNKDIRGQVQHIRYLAKKLNTTVYKHKEFKDYYNRYRSEQA